MSSIEIISKIETLKEYEAIAAEAAKMKSSGTWTRRVLTS